MQKLTVLAATRRTVNYCQDPSTRVVINCWHTLLVGIVDHGVAPTVSSARGSSEVISDILLDRRIKQEVVFS
jgi:hypothetical protein